MQNWGGKVAPRLRAPTLGVACAALISIWAAPQAHAVTYESAAPFCDGAVLHDYLAPLKRLPKLHNPRPTGRIGFGPAALRVRPNAYLHVGLGKAGYKLFLVRSAPVPRLNWRVLTTLELIDWRGRRVRVVRRKHRDLRRLTRNRGAGVGFAVFQSRLPYRVTTVFRDGSGRKLGGYGFYVRVVPSVRRTKLGLNAASYGPESTVFGRIENFGTTPVSYGAPYTVDRLEGTSWVKVPESPRRFILPRFGIGPGTAGTPCSSFGIDPTMQPGRYRMSKEITYGPRAFGKAERTRTLSAEFDVVP